MGNFRIGDRVMFKAPPEYAQYPRWKAATGSTGTVTDVDAPGENGSVSVLLDAVNPEAGWHERQVYRSMVSCWVHCPAPAEFPSIRDVEVFLNG